MARVRIRETRQENAPTIYHGTCDECDPGAPAAVAHRYAEVYNWKVQHEHWHLDQAQAAGAQCGACGGGDIIAFAPNGQGVCDDCITALENEIARQERAMGC